MSKACAPPLPIGLSMPGEHEDPGGTTPPPRSSVTNISCWSVDGSASWEIATPSSDLTWLLELQLRLSVGLSRQSRPGCWKVPRKRHPVAAGAAAGSTWLQSVTRAAGRVPGVVVQGGDAPCTWPRLVTRFDTSRISVALTAAQ